MALNPYVLIPASTVGTQFGEKRAIELNVSWFRMNWWLSKMKWNRFADRWSEREWNKIKIKLTPVNVPVWFWSKDGEISYLATRLDGERI